MKLEKKVLVAGLGKSGIGAAQLLLKVGARVVLFDEKEDLDKEGILDKFSDKENISIVLGNISEELAKTIDLMVISPGIPYDAQFTNIIRENNKPICSEIELAFMASKGEIAAITGTNGKTTTTSLVGEIMKAYYDSVFVVGNIGTPYTSIATETTENSRIVAEISSFQLETIIDFKPKVSAILNITPDHLNRHKTMENYAATKLKITMNQEADDICVLNYDDSYTKEMANEVKSKVVFFSRLEKLENGVFIEDDNIVLCDNGDKIIVMPLSELKILGAHNVENAMAAVAISYYMGVPIEVIRKTSSEFMGVEHRIEYVATIENVDYYNDSKGTNPDAAIKGIEAMNKPTLLIGGGYDKGVEFDQWIDSFNGKVRYLILIGATADKIANTAKKHGFNDILYAHDLKEAVEVCHDLANPNNAVLLSPACASWGMFDNYEQRGNLFKDYVNNLKG